MEDFLLDGKLNPVINTTQKNFLKIFAARIIEDDLAFTTGKTDGIHRLFEFLESRYQLPSDTTVRNTLAQMYIDMYRVLKSELAVSSGTLSRFYRIFPTSNVISGRKIEDRNLGRYVDNARHDLSLHSPGGTSSFGKASVHERLLEIFTQVTLQMSCSSTPTLPWVLPMYEKMLMHLRAWGSGESVPESVRTAASAGLGELETYYSKARGCQFNVIAT
ncbi:hypothetical protein C8R44DRAFT_721855, partial [Mycena epipterygia]